MITVQLFKNKKTGEIVDTIPMMSLSDYEEYTPQFNKLQCVSIYRSAGSDCTNGGPSSFYNTIQLVYKDGAQIERYDMMTHSETILNEILGTPELDPIAEKVFVALQLTQGDSVYHYAVPLSMLLEGKQTMAGGNLIACSDSRFRRIAQSMAVHDRVEG